MYKLISFQPHNFGGYTLSMILSGLFLGYTTHKSWWYIIVSVIIFFVGMYFYAKDNIEENK